MTKTNVHVYADNDRYRARIESVSPGEGEPEEAFLHLDVHEWNKTTLKLIRQDLEDILSQAHDMGLDCVAFYLHKDITTKFHNMVKPLDFEEPIPDYPDYIVGGWLIDEVM